MRFSAHLALLALAGTAAAAPTSHKQSAAGAHGVNRPAAHVGHDGGQKRDADCGWLRESCLNSCEGKPDYWKFICRDLCNTFIPC